MRNYGYGFNSSDSKCAKYQYPSTFHPQLDSKSQDDHNVNVYKPADGSINFNVYGFDFDYKVNGFSDAPHTQQNE